MRCRLEGKVGVNSGDNSQHAFYHAENYSPEDSVAYLMRQILSMCGTGR